MIRSNLARATIDGIRGRIQIAEQGKKRILDLKNQLDSRYKSREITYENYIYEYSQKIDGRTIKEWLKYYNTYIAYCRSEIRKHGRHITNNKILLVFFSLAMILTLSLSTVFIGPTIVGFVVQDENASSIDEVVDAVDEISEEVPAEEPVSEEASGENATVPEIIEPTEENATDEVVSENATEENITGTETPEENITKEVPDETIVEEPLIDEVELIVSTLQYRAVIGRPVKWIKTINTSDGGNLTIELPKDIENISILTDEEVSEALLEIDEYEDFIDGADREEIVEGGLITGNVALDVKGSRGLLSRFWKWLTGFTISGNVILEEDIVEDIVETENATVVNVGDIIGNEKKVAVEYYTEAPQSFETELDNGKEVIVSGPEDIHYTDILAYTELDNLVSLGDVDKIKLYHVEIDEYENFEAYDLDSDGNIDYIEWVVPHLSNQTYLIIIEITAAEHLDFEKNFVADVYDLVKEHDGVWFDDISDDEYLRVTFEKNLTSSNDITLYARGNGLVQVYEKDEAEVLISFEIVGEGLYKKYLVGLVGEQDTFDLKVLGDVDIDWVVDPTVSDVLSVDGSFDDTTKYNTWTHAGTLDNDGQFVHETSSPIKAGGGSLEGQNLVKGKLWTGEYVEHSTTSMAANSETWLYFSWQKQYVTAVPDSSVMTITLELPDTSTSQLWTNSDTTWDSWTDVSLNITSDVTQAGTYKLRLECTLDTPSTNGVEAYCFFDEVVMNNSATDSVAPSVTLVEPADIANLSSSSVDFNCTSTDSGDGLANSTLYGDWSGGWHANNTQDITGASNYSNWTKTISDGNYDWNCYVCDGSSNCDFATSNYSFTVDTVAPIIHLESPADDTLNTTSPTPDFSFNVTDSLSSSLDCTLWLQNSTGQNVSYGQNSTTLNATSITITANASLDNRDYYWFVNCSDNSGNEGSSTELWNISINVDQTKPNVTLESPANDSTETSTTVEFNCSGTDSGGLKNATLYFSSGSGSSGWQAFNDVGTPWTGSSSNITNISSDGAGQGTEDYLRNYATSEILDAYVIVTGDVATTAQGGAATNTSSDAYKIFGSKLDLGGIMSYAEGDHTFVFTNLSSSKKYRFVHFGNRGDSAYTTRTSKVIISDADSFEVNSSDGVTLSTTTTTNDSATYVTGYNNISGYVAAWTNIEPGSDGDFTITVTTGTYQYTTAIMLEELAGGTSWHANETNDFTGTSNSTVFTKTLTDNVTYNWNCLVSDNSSNTNWSVSNYSFTVNTSLDTSDQLPVVALNSPDGTIETSTWVVMNCTVTDDYDLDNVTLYGNWSGGWHANETNTSGIDGVYLFNKSLTDLESYEWNCYACDNNTNCSFAVANYTFDIDASADIVKPNVTLESPDNDSTETSTTVEFNCSGTDGVGLANATLYFKSNSGGELSYVDYITNYSVWKYNDSDVWPGDGWYNETYDDSSWPSGAGGLATSAETEGLGHNTTIDGGTYSYTGYYFRQEFTIDDASLVENMSFNIDYDDVYGVYINGELVDSSVSCDFETHSSTCGVTHNSLMDVNPMAPYFPKYTLNSTELGYLVDGTNYLAVAIKQPSATSTDAAFQLMLYGWENSGTSWHANETINITGVSNSTLFTKTLEDNVTYNWNCLISDNSSNTNWSVSNYTFLVNTSAATGSSPIIFDVWNETMTDVSSGPTEDSPTYVIINFSVSDTDGFGDLNDSSAKINFTFGGASRSNSSCSRYEGSGDYANYTCNVTMWWFDAAGTWSIEASIEDNTSNQGANNTATFLMGSTAGFESTPSSLTWDNIAPGATGIEPSNHILMNNTGNIVRNVEVNATNLLGESNPAQALWAANFSVYTAAGCGGTSMVADTYTTVAGANLPVGNYTIGDGTGQEEIYVCLEAANAILDAQTYSTAASGSWTIRIFMVFLTLKAKKKKKNKTKLSEKELILSIDSVLEDAKDEAYLSEEKLTELLLERIKYQYMKNKEVLIPLSIFSKKLGALEALAKYMKENLEMKYSEIGRLLSRNERTIWASYNKAKKKQGVTFNIKESGLTIPLSKFHDADLTVMEIMVVYLKDHMEKKYSDISGIIDRDQRNIWVTYSKAKEKMEIRNV